MHPALHTSQAQWPCNAELEESSEQRATSLGAALIESCICRCTATESAAACTGRCSICFKAAFWACQPTHAGTYPSSCWEQHVQQPGRAVTPRRRCSKVL